MKKLQQGFTLIELLVVISIIGLLASVVLVALNGARAKARDARRKADLKQIGTALDLFYGTNNTYLIPSTGYLATATGFFSYAGTGSGAGCSGGDSYCPTSIAQGLANTGLVNRAPVDPSGATGMGAFGRAGYMMYGVIPNGLAGGYCLYAGLENPTAADNASYAAITGAGGSCTDAGSLCGGPGSCGVNYVITHQ